MPKKNRLTRDELKDFKGKRLHGALFSLTFAPLPSHEKKAAVVVSKKAAPKAHDRNLIKRRVRSIVSKAEVHGSFVLLAKAGAARASFAEVERDVLDLLGRASRA